MKNRRIFNERVKDEDSLLSAMEAMGQLGNTVEQSTGDDVVNESDPVEQVVDDSVETVESVEETTTDEVVDDSAEVVESNEETVVDEVESQEATEEVVDDEDIYKELNEAEDVASEATSEGSTETNDEVFQSISKEIGIEVNNISELKAELDKKIEEAKSSVDEWKSGLPKDLVEAVELAKNGGDYLDYLSVSSIDYSTVPDSDLVASILIPDFLDKEGNVDNEALNTYMDSMSEEQVRIEASRIRRNYIEKQEASKQAKQAEMVAKKEKMANGINKALDNFNDLGGYKVSLSEKNYIRNAVTNDTIARDLFLDSKGNLDYSKVSEVIFKYRNFDKIKNHLESKVRNSTKREIISNMSNQERRQTSTPVASTPEDRTSPAFQQKAWIDGFKNGK